MLKLIQKLIITLAIVAIGTPSYACGKWVLEYSDRIGGRSGKMVNYCYYQDLSGYGQAMSVQMPLYKECPVILDPCPEGGSDTTVTVNQPSPEKTYAPPVKSPVKTYEPMSDAEYDRWQGTLSEAEKAEQQRSFQETYDTFIWEQDYKKLKNGSMSKEEFNNTWIGYGVHK